MKSPLSPPHSRLSWRSGALGGLLLPALIFLCAGAATADCFQSQIDMDFLLNVLQPNTGMPHPGLSAVMTTWDTALWSTVTYQQGPSLSGADNDNNGIIDDDQFDLLAAVRDGAADVVANIPADRVTAIRTAFNNNVTNIQNIEITINNVNIKALGGIVNITKNVTTGQTLTLSVLGQTINTDVPSVFKADNAILATMGTLGRDAVLDTAACYMTIGDANSVTHLQSLMKALAKGLAGAMTTALVGGSSSTVTINSVTVKPNGDIVVVLTYSGIQLTVTTLGTEIITAANNFGAAFNTTALTALPAYLGAAGDLNGDGTTNLSSFSSSGGNRQTFLALEGIVNPPPQITAPPPSLNLTSGDQGSMYISYTDVLGGETAAFKWEQIDNVKYATQGAPVSGADTLEFGYALPTATGGQFYTATICDSLWTRRSAPGVLKVTAATFTIAQQPVGSSTLAPGGSFSMSVKAHGGTVVPTYQWQINNGVGWTNLSSATQATLDLPSLSGADQGSYQCLVTGDNGAGAVTLTSNSAVIQVITAAPNVVGMAQTDAAAQIVLAGLTVGTITEVYSDTVDPGNVISQNPNAGASIMLGGSVALVVSKGLQPLTVPNVVGMTEEEADAALTGNGLLTGAVTLQFSSTVAAGLVISQNPAAGAEVAPGSAVDLAVSKGPQPTTVPNVVGMAEEAAESVLAGADLIAGVITRQYDDIVAAGAVVSQTPSLGEVVPVGSPVALTVSLGPKPMTGSIVINGNASITKTTAVTLSLIWTGGAGTGVVRMRFSDDGAHWTAWETLHPTVAYTLPAGDGYHTVRVQFRDSTGRISDTYRDYILLDTMAPTGSIIINNGASSTTSQSVTLNLTWTDGSGSGVWGMRFSNDGAHWSPWETPAATRAYTLPLPTGRQTVRVQYRDKAGYNSAVYNDYITVLAH